MPVFVRTREQQMIALARANRVRVYRAEVKRNLKAGASVLPILASPAPELATMKVAVLLLALPKWGPEKVGRFLRTHSVSSVKTLGGLSERQRSALVEALS